MKYSEDTKQYLIKQFEEAKKQERNLYVEFIIVGEGSISEQGNDGVYLGDIFIENEREFNGFLEDLEFSHNENPKNGEYYVYCFISKVDIV